MASINLIITFGYMRTKTSRSWNKPTAALSQLTKTLVSTA